MSEQKVTFHPLERLDLIDVEALQEQIYVYISQMLGNLTGGSSTTKAEGMLKQPSSTTITNGTNNAYTIGFSDFIWIDNIQDDNSSRSRQSRVTVFSAADSHNGLCDFATAKTLVQTYYNNNSSNLPYKPSDSAVFYSEAADGQYYPYIWARTSDSNVLQDNRRFWSVANGTEITQNVNTRSSKSTDFTVSYAAPAGTGWTKIARIEEWSLNGASVILNASGIKFIYLADNVVPLPTRGNGSPLFYSSETIFNESDYGGLMGATRIIAQELDNIRSSGIYDASWGISTTNRSLLPLLSLDGCYDAITKLDNRFRTTQRRVSCLIEANMLISGAGYFNVSVDNNLNNQNTDVTYITPTAFADFKAYEALSSAGAAGVSFPFDPTVAYNLSHDMRYTSAMSVYGLDFGEDLSGYHISGTIEPVSSILDNETGKYYDWLSGNITNGGATWTTTPELSDLFEPHNCFFLSDTQGGSSNELLIVSERTGKDANGADITYYGIRFGVSNLRRLARVQNIMATWGLKLKFRVDLTLTKPTEA